MKIIKLHVLVTSLSSKTTKTNVCKMLMFYIAKTACGQIDRKQQRCMKYVQDIENISLCEFHVNPAPIKIGKVIT